MVKFPNHLRLKFKSPQIYYQKIIAGVPNLVVALVLGLFKKKIKALFQFLLRLSHNS